jgi:hypothetical protein
MIRRLALMAAVYGVVQSVRFKGGARRRMTADSTARMVVAAGAGQNASLR